MTTSDYPLYLERRDPKRNMARFYMLSLERDLFGNILATRRWGRIGTNGRQMSVPRSSEQAAIAELEQLEVAKRRRGYVDYTPMSAGNCASPTRPPVRMV